VTLALVAAVLAGAGILLLLSSLSGAAPDSDPVGNDRTPPRRSQTVGSRFQAIGIAGVSPAQVLTAVVGAGLAGGLAGFVLFGGVLAPAACGLFSAWFPLAGFRHRRAERMEKALEAWPRLLEELRLRTGSLGRSVPQALFESARNAPPEWQQAFATAERLWLLTTDFARTVGQLKAALDQPTADVVLETLLLAHEVGGSDLDARLVELIEDRNADVQSRKDAASRQAGVRFARRFVLLVPLGMALAGLSIGAGRQAYETAGGQLAVLAGVISVMACWIWSGRLMRVPQPPRVFQ
jgi:tight adherence protein B